MTNNMTLQLKWQNNPEPDKETLTPDGDIILDTQTPRHNAYLWESHNSKDGWLAFNGELAEVHR
jgi:hypothetical protein